MSCQGWRLSPSTLAAHAGYYPSERYRCVKPCSFCSFVISSPCYSLYQVICSYAWREAFNTPAKDKPQHIVENTLSAEEVAESYHPCLLLLFVLLSVISFLFSNALVVSWFSNILALLTNLNAYVSSVPWQIFSVRLLFFSLGLLGPSFNAYCKPWSIAHSQDCCAKSLLTYAPLLPSWVG
jgi:hypothetical protein